MHATLKVRNILLHPLGCPDKPIIHRAVMAYIERLSGLLGAGGDAEYDEFTIANGRTHTSQQQYEQRRQVYHANKALIGQSNAHAAGLGYTLALNHFADWTEVGHAQNMSNAGRGTSECRNCLPARKLASGPENEPGALL